MTLPTVFTLSRVVRNWRPVARNVRLATLCVLAPAPVHATTQYATLPPPEHVSDASSFRIEQDAASQLHALWDASLDARQERVACLGGYRDGSGWRLTRIEPLLAAADSLGVSATTSIERCGPPLWLGTVHTHIALRPDGRPYTTFSGADRGIMSLWWRRWRASGVFCVLYTARDAHCEADGQLVAGPGTHATY